MEKTLLEFGFASEYSGFHCAFTIPADAADEQVEDSIRAMYDALEQAERDALSIEWMDGDEEQGSYLVTHAGSVEDCPECQDAEFSNGSCNCESCGYWAEYVTYRAADNG